MYKILMICLYFQDKFLISDSGEKAIFSRINDAWRRYKSYIKRHHFVRYSTMKERMKHRPLTIPEDHFKQLITYWKNTTIQVLFYLFYLNTY